MVAQEVTRDARCTRESPYYQEILQEGREEGKLEGQRETLLAIVQARFPTMARLMPDSGRAGSSKLPRLSFQPPRYTGLTSIKNALRSP